MRRSAPGGGAGLGRVRRGPLLLVGVLACAAAGGLLVLILLPGTPGDRPAEGGGAGSTQPAEAPQVTEEALRKETFAVVRQLMADFPRSSDAVGLMGTVHNRFGNTAEAVRWWRECLQRNPRRADMYHGLATVALRKGEYQEAVGLWRKAQAVNPKLPDIYGHYAEALLEMGKLDEAIAALRMEIRISPGVSDNHILLGKIHLQRKEYQEAARAYARAIEMQPRDSRPHYGLATAYARLGQGDKAGEHVERFRALRAKEDRAAGKRRRRSTGKPVHASQILAQALADAGRVYYGHRQFQKAERRWRRAAALDPRNAACRQQLVDLYRRSRRGQEAVEVCEQLRRIAPENATYHLNTGMLLAELGRFGPAEEAVRKAVELAPKRPAGYRSLVQVLLFGNHKLPEARALAQRLVKLEPTARNYSLLGEACRRNADPSGALAALRRAAELAPNNKGIQDAYKALQKRH